ncbi:MAG: agmatine deiminase family protein [Prevotella sp.]|nr:agmatine deiminase family protein [Prevotella sp.]
MKKFTKLTMLLLLFFTLASVASAQNTEQKGHKMSLHQLLNKKSYNGEYPLPQFPTASGLISRAESAPLNFPDRVWFPGEWEEVKAILVCPTYYYQVPGYENDKRYSARPIVQGYAGYYYQATDKSEVEYYANGPYTIYLDVEQSAGLIPLYIMDAVQKAGAEAWVRVERAEDEQVVRNALAKQGLRNDKMQFFVAPGNSVWFRDCGPICFYYGDEDKLGMLDFLYYNHRALDDMLPSVLHRKFGIPNYINDVVWEGGNCLVDGVGGLVTSTATYGHNDKTEGRMVWDGVDYNSIHYQEKAALTEADVKAALSGMLGQRQTIIIPKLNYDGGTGHIDLYLDATDENSFLIAQMPEAYDFWTDYDIAYGNTNILLNKKTFFSRKYYDGGAIPFPALDDGSQWESEEDYGEVSRTYANHLLCNNYLIQPCFSPVDENHMPTAAWDRANIEKMKELYPGYTFYCIDMRMFDGSGGSVHCITKQIPADNPLRIIHKNIYGKVNPGTLTDIPFSSIITNKSGIKSAKLVYRVNEGEWMEVALTGNGNCWSSSVSLDDFLGSGQPLTAEGTNVEYYIEATSNNGKTVTKPVSAAYGAYYDFTLTSNADYDDNMFDFETSPVGQEYITYQLDTSWLTEDTSTDEDETGVVELKENKSSMVSGAWYTIDGQRLGSRPAVKGIYLFGGKKVVIK